jgi:glycosyltransferase involved in cell wall biosynthesis
MSNASRAAASGVPADAPLVSVIVPTFNRLKYLRPAMESVLAQTYSNWELLIADDGSEGETAEYLRELGLLPNVKIIWMPHSGIPAAVRNAALRQARGEFVAFLDSDDVWERRKLEAHVAVLRAHSRCDWSYSAFTNIDEHGVPLPTENQRRWSPCEGDIFERMLRGEVSLRTPCVVASRRLLLEAGAFDESIRSAEDYDLWYRLALHSGIAVVDESLVCIRAHGENHSADWSSAYAGQDHTFTKLQRLVESPRRDLMRRERARNVLRLAYGHAVLRQRAQVFRSLLRGFAFSWHYAEWWIGALRSVLRSFLPERALAIYRRRASGSA